MEDRIVGFLIKSQQFYLKELGFYDGEIDGVWGLNSRTAMEDFKKDPRYSPASLRRSSSAFTPFERLPKGFKWGVFDGQRGIIKEEMGTPYVFVVQKLVDGILGLTDSENGEGRRDAFRVLGEQRKTESDLDYKDDSGLA